MQRKQKLYHQVCRGKTTKFTTTYLLKINKNVSTKINDFIRIFTVTLFKILKTWEQLKCLLTGERTTFCLDSGGNFMLTKLSTNCNLVLHIILLFENYASVK